MKNEKITKKVKDVKDTIKDFWHEHGDAIIEAWSIAGVIGTAVVWRKVGKVECDRAYMTGLLAAHDKGMLKLFSPDSECELDIKNVKKVLNYAVKDFYG